MTPLGLYLRKKRDEQNVSQKQMAAAIGVSPAYLSALEHGNRGVPSFAMLQRIIGYLNIIWDEAELVQQLALLSNPRTVLDTTELSAEATEFANLLAEKIGRLDQKQIKQMRDMLVGLPTD